MQLDPQKMKRIVVIVCFFTIICHINGQTPSLEIEFTTVDMGGFSHEKHVLAELNNNHSQGPLAEIDFTIDQNSLIINH